MSEGLNGKTWPIVFVVAALTGGTGLGANYRATSSVADKLDAIKERLDKLEGADEGKRVDDHETRLRRVEEALAVLRAERK